MEPKGSHAIARLLAKSSAPEPVAVEPVQNPAFDLLKAHIDALKQQLLLKSKGNPHHDPKTGRFGAAPVEGDYSAWLPPSGHIETLSDAKKYYAEHIAGVWTLIIKRKSGLRKVRINMNANEWHAYTKTVGEKRIFWPERAKRMCAIIHSIANPGVVLVNGDRDLFVERVSAGDHDVVVLAWNPDKKEYSFRSYHYWSREEYIKFTGQTDKGGYPRAPMRGVKVEKVETPIRKSVGVSVGTSSLRNAPASFTNLHRTSLAGSFELGGAHSGICWPHDGSIVFVAQLVKSDGHEVIAPWSGAVYRASHEPTRRQLEAGNYKKRKLQWRGLTISIENEPGSVRRGVDRDGHEWQTRMVYAYGYIRGTTGADDEHVDCYVGPDMDATMVYMVDQLPPTLPNNAELN